MSDILPFTQFLPLVKDVADILNKVIDLYSTAQHNKRITKLLIERIAAANSAIMILREEDLYSSRHYINLQKFVEVLQKMKNYSEEITQYSKVQKFLGAQKIEEKFTDLCKDYENGIRVLNLNLMIDFNIRADRDKKDLQDDLKELQKFQSALAESISYTNKKMDNMDKKVSEIVEKVSTMANTMQSLGEKGNQTKIDSIFHESPLPFQDYEETKIFRGDKLRKYINVKTREGFAFKSIEKDNRDMIKNQVTILKKLKDCQNIIHFYGFTYDESNMNYYLITEWAENKNLREYIKENGPGKIGMKVRLGFAYDIAKGLNFLNAVKIVHRDIRSENIVITDRNIAKITNFKVSRAFESATNNLAVDKECVRHSSPEMLRRGMTGEVVDKDRKKKYDTKCEVYSFGILLWEIAECKTPYEKYDDFMEITQKVVSGYREPFTPNSGIPEEYQELVNDAVHQNPGKRPIFSQMLTTLQDIFNNYDPEKSTKRKTVKKVPERKDSVVFSWSSFNYLTIEKAVEEHNTKKNGIDKNILYKCFDTYANMGNPKAKYWKAYYIVKGWSDLKCSTDEKNKIAAELFKEAADRGDAYPDAQLRYALMVMQGKGYLYITLVHI
ncbi:kinase-like domain-containing protein [Glomus cerebriforme]|uniref:Kinase-like domain-containing protein n=1 Tax=Glomus cerebriforme TaxID=658196 RepID=A0A397TWV3_9GLOM|nr:kinase-like domain-containing protein [Glomus cerebriforme]